MLGVQMTEKKGLTDAEEKRYDKQLRKLSRLILPDLTPKQLRDLGTGHVADIAVAFFVASGETVPDKMALTNRMQTLVDSLPRPIGAKSSRGSRGSTSRRQRRKRG